MRSAGVFVATALLAVGACGLPSADEFSSGTRDGGSSALDGGADVVVSTPLDGSITTTDAETLVPTSDGGADAALPFINLLPKHLSDFEGACAGGGGYLATVQGSTTPHAGAYSCNVCRDPETAEIWSLDTGLTDPAPAPGREYTATAWVRLPPGSTDTLYVALALRTQSQGYDQIENEESSPMKLTDQWQQLSLTIVVTKPAKRMDTYVYAENEPGLVVPCFLVDDYVVWRSK